jgi:hypothetical protein
MRSISCSATVAAACRRSETFDDEAGDRDREQEDRDHQLDHSEARLACESPARAMETPHGTPIGAFVGVLEATLSDPGRPGHVFYAPPS